MRQQLSLGVVVHFPKKLDQAAAEHRTNDLLKVVLVGSIDLRANSEWQSCRLESELNPVTSGTQIQGSHASEQAGSHPPENRHGVRTADSGIGTVCMASDETDDDLLAG